MTEYYLKRVRQGAKVDDIIIAIKAKHMTRNKLIHVVSAHAEGEVGDVIVSGVEPPPGETLWDMRNWIASDDKLRRFMLNEPRGGVFRHVNLLVPPKSKVADAAFIIMEPADTPPMSGSNTMCVATVLLERGLVAMTEPHTELILEAPAGLIKVSAKCENRKVKRLFIENVASFVDKRSVHLEVSGMGTLTVSTAYGGDSFVIVDAKRLGFSLTEDEGRELVETGIRITNAANQQLGFSHPELPDWSHISFCLLAGPLEMIEGIKQAKSAVAIQPGKLDRSPTGTGCSARLALLHEQGKISVGEKFIGRSILNTQFCCRIKQTTQVAEKAAIIPIISGRVWITGYYQHIIDNGDPFPFGYRISDTWPRL